MPISTCGLVGVVICPVAGTAKAADTARAVNKTLAFMAILLDHG